MGARQSAELQLFRDGDAWSWRLVSIDEASPPLAVAGRTFASKHAASRAWGEVRDVIAGGVYVTVAEED